jgi:hypothetical protein
VRFNVCSDVEIVWAAKYGISYSNCDVAYANGYLCVVHTDANGTAVGGQTAYVEIFRGRHRRVDSAGLYPVHTRCACSGLWLQLNSRNVDDRQRAGSSRVYYKQRHGDCTLELFISYDDGKTWTTCGTQSLTSADYTSGDPISLLFDPRVHDVDRFALRVDVTNGSNTAGVRLHALAIEAESEEFLTRRPARDMR